MSESQFKPGDVVELKSGGERMTVHEIGANGAVWVNFFDADRQFRSIPMNPDTLQIAAKE